jgi:hypothetical protein|tara:strand:- start:16542 stop:16943 length:402 start_codon:yes stop_codon:yes gene_type:complete
MAKGKYKMGMDVYGKNESYFRASIWRWPSILKLVSEANEKENLGIQLDGWQWNDGMGLSNQDDCDALADALEKIVYPCKASTVFTAGGDDEGAAMGLQLSNALGLDASFEADLGHVKEFISFLRNCGGAFAIW